MTDSTKIVYPKTIAAWRRWLEKHHHVEQSVWVVFYSKNSGRKSLTWSEAVDVALCYGWIDSKKIKIDDERSHQFFSRRKAKGTWSAINEVKIAKLIDEGLMMPAGLKAIEVAKQNGSWTVLDEVERLTIPPDLETAFKKHRGSKVFFTGLSKSIKKQMLQWIALAKRPETRQNRINEVAVLASKNLKPKQF